MEYFREKDFLEEKKDFGFEIIDIFPEKEKYPTPVLVAPGWSVTPSTLEKSLKLLSEKGRRVLSLYHSRKNIVEGPLSLIRSRKEVVETGKEYSFEEVQKAFSILDLLENKNINKIDIVAYSEAGINVSIAASECPEKFRNIIYINPAGMIGEDKFPKLLGRFSLESIKGFIKGFLKSKTRDSLKNFYKESFNYITENIPLSFKEVVAISKTDVRKMMEDLKKEGIGIQVIQGEEDSIFPAQKMKENIGSITDKIYSYKGGHFDIFLEPEKITELIDSALISANEEKK